MSRILIALLLLVPLARAAQPLELYQSSYRLRPGESTQISAAAETIAFLSAAPSRQLTVQGALARGLVLSPSADGSSVILGASLRTNPGTYAVNLGATSASGVHRAATVNVVVDKLTTVPNNSTRPPVVLLNGWIAGFTGACAVATSSSQTFGNLAQYLVSDGVPVVYLFDNCLEDPNQPIETLAADLGTFLNSITYDDGAQVPQIDLVAHSMGGLIARAYLAGLQSGGTLNPPASTLVRDLVLIAVPNFGSFVAANYSTLLAVGTQSAELVPGSSFLWNLATWNQRFDDLRGVNAIAIAGNAGNWSPGFDSTTALTNATDGLVSLTSASLGFTLQGSSVTRVVPYCHIDPSAFTTPNYGTFACNAPGIANVTSTSHPTGQIVRSFLSGTSSWQSVGTTPATDPYLSIDGGLYFALVSEQNNYVSDLTSMQWGTIAFTQGGDTGTVFYDDFIHGTGDLAATSASLGSFNCGNLTEPLGYFSAARCKVDAAIFSIGPVTSGAARVVTSGGNITITGYMFGASQCSGCKVLATPAGSSSTTTTLQVSSWTNASITAALPSTFGGFVTIAVVTGSGTDTMGIMTAPSSRSGTPVLAVTPTALSFTYDYAAAAPAAQTVSLSNSGSGTLTWSASDPDYWVSLSPVSGSAPSTLSISVNPANLAPGAYSSSVTIAAPGATGTGAVITVSLTVTGTPPTPSIAGVGNTGDYQPAFASATWVAVFGSNLSQTTATWTSSDFVNSQLPTSLDAVSVSINGIPAYVEYVSPTQINVLAPDDSTTGTVNVTVTTAGQASNSFSAPKQPIAPVFFTLDSAGHVTATHADGTLVSASQPAASGETVVIYGTGFGPTNPATPTATLVASPALLANAVQIAIGGANADVAFAGLVGPGLYQFNVVIPALPTGDASITASLAGVQTQSGLSITIQ